MSLPKPEPSEAKRIALVATAQAGDPSFMTSLARGLAVLGAFTSHSRVLTGAELARETGLSRAAVQRCLHTLELLGYVAAEGRGYALRPRVLGLGHAYLTSASLARIAQPVLDEVRDQLKESCSLGVLDDDELLYVARAEISRIMSISLHPGSRLPAYCTSMGRVLLAERPLAEQREYLRKHPRAQLTERTCIDAERLLDILAKVRKDGFSLVDQELEPGLRSLAVPIRNQVGELVAAINVGTQAARISARQLVSVALPSLRAAAEKLRLQVP
ncbi:IclR family transcriptional regulator domain-containing protein [Stigmatella aurantiaca]|uniref:Transcriptional regulator n=1 Tax=Stigmatella aurantiaca (strain DW4/3-1) TaxID=378806 RepID=Q09B95_STIAD|nr:IclR family transcriptional regulator C-terminal domain-containing protein [Stigmatella aurantiaca]ADO69146.1 Transcriptional regulator [Stigmatella aurantiaca DW4/3-1]EAU68930.1 transcriptional regulator [Stigmatella aurantiaca DW4/3-1]